MKKALFVVAAMTLASVASAAPFVWPAKWSADAPREAKRGGELRLSALSDYKTLNPFTTTEAGNIPALISNGSGLFTQDPTTDDFIPYMADGEAEISNGGRRIVVDIRKGMKFSDGQEMTADDWVTTWKIHTDKEVGSNSYSNFFLANKPITVKKLGTYRLQFDFPSVSSTAISRISYTPWPDHIFGKAYTAGGAEAIKKMWTLNTDPDTIVSPGMWVLDSYRVGERAILKRNPQWGEWNKDSAGAALPYLDRVSYTIVKDVNAGQAAFLAGQIDVPTSLTTADQLSQIKRAIDGGQLKANLIPNVSPQASSTWITWTWNKSADPYKQKLFRDVRFRRAMSHLADRKAMVDLVYGGFGSPSYYSLYPIFEKAWAPATTPKYEYNLDQAAKLLSEIGYKKKDKDGWLVDAQGRRLEFNLSTNAGNNQREGLMKIFADTAKKIGVKVNTQAIDFNVLVNQLTSTGADRPFDAILLGLSNGGNVWPFGTNVVPCSGNLHSYNTSGKCLTSQESLMDKLYYQGDAELNLAKRKAIGAQLLKVETELQPVVYLASPNAHVAFNTRLGGEYPRNLMDAYYGSRAQALTFIK